MADGSNGGFAPKMTTKARKEPDIIDVQVGARIRVARKRIGLSQEALADAIGVTFQQVQKYERGANRISASMISRVAKATGTTVAILFGEGQPESQNALLSNLSAPYAVDLLVLYGKASKEARNMIMAAARASDAGSS